MLPIERTVIFMVMPPQTGEHINMVAGDSAGPPNLASSVSIA